MERRWAAVAVAVVLGGLGLGVGLWRGSNPEPPEPAAMPTATGKTEARANDGVSVEKTMSWSTRFPIQLTELHRVEFDFDDMDYEPYDEFLTMDEVNEWFRAWTGNPEADGTVFRVFGMDGTGGHAAIWLAREGVDLLEQPVVFLGSEGETGIVARDFADYLWLLAGGVGPLEAVEYGAGDAEPNEAFTGFARKHAPEAEKSAAEVLDRARAEYPGFEAYIDAMCR